MAGVEGLLGIDLGTSSAKVVVTDTRGRLLARGASTYPVYADRPEWAEQDPREWWQAIVLATRQALSEAAAPTIRAVGLSGQMHGLVLINRQRRSVGRAVIWLDRRSKVEAQQMAAQIGQAELARVTGTAPAPGFMAPTLLWLRRRDPARLDKAAWALLPKDYLRLRLTGREATEPSDASGTGLFDVGRRRWAESIVRRLDLPFNKLPPVLDSAQVAGRLLPEPAAALGLPAGIPVACGCADQAAQAVGNGVLDPGEGSLTIGSGGQFLLPTEQPQADSELRWHAFCHAPAERWYQLGAMLTAGLALSWLGGLLGLNLERDGFEELATLADQTPPGAEGLTFLPHLAGERSPHMDPDARGAFVGLTLQHKPGHLARSVMEGVAFALRQVMTVVAGSERRPERLLAAGNGLASPVWRQIVADVLGRSLHYVNEPERTAVGAALVSGIAAGLFSNYQEARLATRTPTKVIEPNARHRNLYDDRFQTFMELYPALKP